MVVAEKIETLLPGVKIVDEWKSRVDVAKLRKMMDTKRGRLSAAKRTALLKALTEGTRPPKEFLEEWGYSCEDFRDPVAWMKSVRNGEPGAYIAFLKQRLKMFEMGAVAFLGVGKKALNKKVKGKNPIPLPETIITEGPDKNRTIVDWSVGPGTLSGKGPANPSANEGFASNEVSCTFPDLRDKAAMIAAFGGGWMTLLDIKGMFATSLATQGMDLGFQAAQRCPALPGDSTVVATLG